MIDFNRPEIISLPQRTGSKGASISPINLAVYGKGSGPAVVLCHGFPEMGYSWRHQISALTQAGFHVIVPDQRGYGASDAPDAIDEYSLEYLTADLAGILDHYNIEKAVFVGHDWGGFVVWAMPHAFPERTAGIIGVNTPYVSFRTTTQLKEVFEKDEDNYILWFQKDGVAEGVLDTQVDLVFDKIMRGGVKNTGFVFKKGKSPLKLNPFSDLETKEGMGPVILNQEEYNHYTRTYRQSGFRGGINWYRNIDKNVELYPEIGVKPLDLPCLMVTAEWDFVLPPAYAAKMPELCSDLEIQLIKECGHWTQQEKPKELNEVMIEWLTKKLL